MPNVARTVRSDAMPAAPRRPSPRGGTRRPQLHVVTGGKTHPSRVSAPPDAWRRLVGRLRPDRSPLFHIVSAVVFLSLCLLLSLLLRTQMVENSFQASQIELSISQLSQDVEDDQSKLDSLDASLPERAQRMGMIPQQKSITIDLKGYRPSVFLRGQR